jgi:nucleotide-binding universal stress UspA family protein
MVNVNIESKMQIDQKQEPDFIPMKKVLIALDLDPSAMKVAEAGYALARTMNARITLLHVLAEEVFYTGLEYSPITGFTGFNSTDFSVKADTEGIVKASEYFLDKIRDHFHDESIEILVETGGFPDTIIETAENLESDLIVMGSHSKRWLDKILMGSVTEKVLHHTTIPLLIIPTKQKSEGNE